MVAYYKWHMCNFIKDDNTTYMYYATISVLVMACKCIVVACKCMVMACKCVVMACKCMVMACKCISDDL